ncbi:MAG: sporulation transcription factor Spo0A [Clostridia bacterium]
MTDNKLKIMIVDDNKDFLSITKSIFEKEDDLEVVATLTDPLEVAGKIEELQPDMMLLDLMMPGKEGLEVLKETFASNVKKKPQVIIMSGLGQDAITQKAIELGACHYIVKPFEFATLVSRVRMFGESNNLNQLSENTNVTYAVRATKRVVETLEMRVTDLIHEVGVPAHIRGYRYVREGIMLAVENKDYIDSITKMLYPELALRFDTTPSRIERAIRHAIEVAWSRGSVEVQNKIFGYTINSNKGKPTNAEFVAKISDRLSVEDHAVNA